MRAEAMRPSDASAEYPAYVRSASQLCQSGGQDQCLEEHRAGGSADRDLGVERHRDLPTQQ